ncbi:MAG: ribonuclease Z [Clostridia bacterium]|nr:ribonuclease Z [Clostridia bacterium]
MRIVFFGTSHGVPEPNRRCSSTLIEIGERRYFVDMGTQSIEQLISRRIPVESVKGVFITHMHGDHANGLVSFLDLCSWYFRTADPVVCLPEPVEMARDTIAAWIKCNHAEMRPFRFLPVKEGVVYEDEAIRVTAYPTRHLEGSHAFLIEAEGKRVLFTGDLGGPSIDFPVQVLDQPLELAVCECAHFQGMTYVPVLEGKTTLKQMCFNHYTTNATLVPPTEEISKALGDIPVFCATDGMEIVL